MARISNCIFAFLNSLLLFVSLVTIAASLFLRFHHDSNCHKLLQDPLLIIGATLLVVSLLGLIGSCCQVTFVLWIYSFLTYVFIMATIVFAIFSFVVTNKDAGKALSGLGKLGDYNNWLRNHFVNGNRWDNVKSCFLDAQVCKDFGSHLSTTQFGCCKPPEPCGFIYENATTWMVPATGPAVQDADCNTWSNDQGKLCYDCNSCKSGFLEDIKKEWRILAIFNVCVLCFMILIYATSCCTRRNIKSRSKYYN